MTWKSGSSPRCPTPPGCTPGMAATPRSAPSGRISVSGAPAADNRGLADLGAVDHGVAEVTAGGVVEGAAAGDEVQFRVGCGAVDLAGGETVLRVPLDRGHAEHGQAAVGAAGVDALARPHVTEPVKDARAKVGVDVPGDHRGTHLTRPRAARVPARHRGDGGHLKR